MTDLPPERTLHIWDRALLELYKAELTARLNESLTLGAGGQTYQQARQLLRRLRKELKAISWLPTKDAKRETQTLSEALQSAALGISDGIERQELDEAHRKAIEAFQAALDERILESDLRSTDQSFFDSTGKQRPTLDDVKDELFAISSPHSRAPDSWWESVWQGTLPRRITPPEFNLYLDPGDASTDDIRELLAALNALHESAGGNGFIFRVEEDRLVMSMVNS